tara:strand:+ start:742 stop:930 length:189 start_codon:yes stop_codon:yes gene_type:complete
MNSTQWAIQPSYWGNTVRIGAELRDTFAAAEDTALDMATEFAESMMIFKVGTLGDIKWKEVN